MMTRCALIARFALLARSPLIDLIHCTTALEGTDRLLWGRLPPVAVLIMFRRDLLLALAFCDRGYTDSSTPPPKSVVVVLTPPSIVATLASGYKASVHLSAR